MTPLDRINAILGSPRHRYVIGEIEYDEYRAMTEPSDTWPKHPDGTNMSVGEMSVEDRQRVTREASERSRARLAGEYATLDPDQRAAVDEMIRVCRNSGQRAERIFPDLVAEVYAYKNPVGTRIHWGMNSLNDGCNFKRGIVE